MSRVFRLITKSIAVKCAVGIRVNDEGGFGLTVDFKVSVDGLSQEDAEKVVAAGHKAYPYSNAIKGNVDVNIKVVAVQSY